MKSIGLFHKVDPEILKTQDQAGNNLLHDFITTCEDYFSQPTNNSEENLNRISTFLDHLLTFKEISTDCMVMENSEGLTPRNMLDQKLGIIKEIIDS